MQIPKRRLIAAVVLIAAATAAALWWQSREQNAAADTLTLYGNVDIRQVQMAFNGSERIATMPVQEGAEVRRGQVVATLDPARLQLARDQAAAQVAAQTQVVARLVAGSRPEDIRKAQADRDAARADARAARLTATRLSGLAARHLASRQQADDAVAAADAADARLKAADAALQLVLAGPRAEDIAAAKATLQAYRAQLGLAQRQLADATLIAPADGVIEDRLLEPGDMASPQTPVYTLALTDPIWVRAYVDEPDLGKVRQGMAAAVTTDSYPGKSYRAWIGYISPTAEFTPKSVETTRVRTDLVYQLRVYVCNPQQELRLGMPATVHIDLHQSADAAAPCGKP